MNHYFLKPLKIHVWGGLGSQLYAWVLANNLRNSPRELRLVFHTGGVTQRQPEIIPLLANLASYEVVHDFQSTIDSSSFRHERRFGRKFLAGIIRKIGFSVESLESSAQIKLWTIEVRGHYRNIFLPRNALLHLCQKLSDIGVLLETNSEDTIAVHYRLGDLVGLKPTIPPEHLDTAIKQSKVKCDLNSIDIYSDSLDLAEKSLKDFAISYNLVFRDLDIWDTLSKCVRARCFIGTSSKISYWVVYLRLALDSNSLIFMPQIFESDLKDSIGSLSEYPNVNFY